MMMLLQEELSHAGWSENEKHVISEQKWWSQAELLETNEVIFPEGLAALLAHIESGGESGGH
ncbi:hypothetical protein [Buttiauxella sp. B2]|uniref:hypothetical protein n=1 Tax=Buttiauxella sp. B2 TaxID=2587812 RepID=UPI00351AAB6A